MADQIIIELIGDPSGLKPAEEALKELSKVSKENMEAFNRANEAAAKFTASAGSAGTAAKGLADSAKEANKAISGISEALSKGIKAISDLNGVIAVGTVKEVTKDFGSFSDKVAVLTKRNEELTQGIAANRAQMDLLKTSGAQAGTLYQTFASQNKDLGSQLGGVNISLKNMGIEIDATTKKVIVAQSETKKLATDTDTLTTATDKSAAAAIRSKKSLKDQGQALSDNLGHASTLTTALGEMGEAIAKAAGNEDAAAEIKKHTAEAIKAITFAQNAATVATEAGTVATKVFELAARSAWAGATLGVSILIGAIIALTGNIKAVTEWLGNLFKSDAVIEHEISLTWSL